MHGEKPISFKIAEAVAEYEGTAVEELHPPLQTVIDPDAIDAMFRSSDSDQVRPMVEFDYKGYTIHVDQSAEVTVTEPAPASCATKEVA